MPAGKSTADFRVETSNPHTTPTLRSAENEKWTNLFRDLRKVYTRIGMCDDDDDDEIAEKLCEKKQSTRATVSKWVYFNQNIKLQSMHAILYVVKY